MADPARSLRRIGDRMAEPAASAPDEGPAAPAELLRRIERALAEGRLKPR